MGVVALEDLSAVIVAKCCSRGTCDIEEKIHAYRKIRSVDESSALLLDQLADTVLLAVPASRAHDHILAQSNAGFDMSHDAVRDCEIDDCGNVLQAFRRQRGAGCVLFGTGDADVMVALAGNVSDQRAGFSTS